MKIYTKKGDAGETGLYGGARVPKDDLRIRAYGTIDELNAALGVALASLPANDASPLRASLLRIQSELFQLGAELATPRGTKTKSTLIEDVQVETLENEIDAMEEDLSPLKSFILPGGSAPAAQLHLVRTISRRAERELVSLNRGEPQRATVLRYLNRLSDYFFVCARFANRLAGVSDVPWSSS
ncbi:MAG: cob(I)yrinic acid a,c-diamide adenosyltransferase [Oligoflexia bacterium]|nr:cob(I)yrinic acid a,c-diamide adenosyltransferase [Oligoflexia bacterium]